MKSRSKRNRKRPRGGVGCLLGDGDKDNNNDDTIKSLLQIETIPLSTAFKIISDASGGDDTKQSNDLLDSNTTANYSNSDDDQQRRRIRIIYPYPFTFATFAKQRWLGRSIVDIYTDEFGKKYLCCIYNFIFTHVLMSTDNNDYWSLSMILSRQLSKKLL